MSKVVNEPLRIDNPFFTWYLQPFKSKEIRRRLYNMFTLKSTQYKVLSTTRIIDDVQFSKSFNPVYTHSGDAFIVYRFHELMIKISKELLISDLPNIGWHTNHDCFYINAEYADRLDCIVKQAYIDFYNLDYLSSKHIPFLKDKEELLVGIKDTALKVEDMTNPKFIKF